MKTDEPKSLREKFTEFAGNTSATIANENAQNPIEARQTPEDALGQKEANIVRLNDAAASWDDIQNNPEHRSFREQNAIKQQWHQKYGERFGADQNASDEETQARIDETRAQAKHDVIAARAALTTLEDKDPVLLEEAIRSDPKVHAHEQHLEHNNKTKNYTDRALMGGDKGPEDVGLMGISVSQSIAAQGGDGKKKEKERSYKKALDHAIEEIERQLSDYRAELGKLEYFERGFQDDIGALERGEKITDESGELLNKEREAKVKEYESKYNVKIDRDDPASLALVLEGIRYDIGTVKHKIDDLKDNLEEAKGVQKAINNNEVAVEEIPEKHKGDVAADTEDLEVRASVYEEISGGYIKEKSYYASDDDLTKTPIKAVTPEGRAITPTDDFAFAASPDEPQSTAAPDAPAIVPVEDFSFS